ncbi:peptidase C1B bleomycin hydrolase [Lactarius psammicola]|nr:peptidase C1B bleomycin hydrolase [Lactarius psammicola]
MGSTPSKPVQHVKVDIDEKRDEFVPVPISCVPTPASADGSLSLGSVSNWETAAAASAKTQLARAILSHSNLTSALVRRQALVADVHVFNTELDFKPSPITNQKSSGRCWLFATTNVLRYEIMKKLNLKEFQLSQSYLFFWDKLNKANYYLELSIQEADRPLDDRLVNHLSSDLISDGGQWDMVVNLLENYGVVPQTVYPESTHSSLSGPLNKLLKTKLREHALVLRNLSSSLRGAGLSEGDIIATLRSKKEELLGEVYSVMSATLGAPPQPKDKFVWDYYDKDGKSGRWEGTAKQFYESFTNKQYPASNSFSLINDPRNPYSKLYTVDKLGNVWGGRPVLYVNTEIENLKSAIVKTLKAGQPVFFGCDVGQFSESSSGIMDTELFEYEVSPYFIMAIVLEENQLFFKNAFDISLSLSKADRLRTNESAMTHAMVISGVHLDPQSGKPLRYKVENSWGEGSGEKGFFVMTDRWFDEFVYQVVVPKTLAPKELVKVFESSDRVVLPPWDPMGSLA